MIEVDIEIAIIRATGRADDQVGLVAENPIPDPLPVLGLQDVVGQTVLADLLGQGAILALRTEIKWLPHFVTNCENCSN